MAERKEDELKEAERKEREPFVIPKTDWQQPLLFDWEGKNGPPFTEEDIYNCVIHRILRDEFYPPWEDSQEREAATWRNYARWNKQNQHPRLSTLTKPQHLSGLKVLSAHYGVPYYSPTPEDYQSFEEIKELYEKEQKEYRLWAKNCWINGDCIRTLHTNTTVEMVYDLQFALRRNKIRTLLHDNFTLAGYISLENRMDAFEFELTQDLKSVDVQILQNISYPDNFELNYTAMDTYVQKPCPQHPCRFILPHENEITALPLPEVHLQLSHFAMENGAEFIASENALQCLLDTERCWKLPMSVAALKCPDGGGVKTVVALGSQFSVQKECGAQRTHDSLRHLLRHAFTTYTEEFPEANQSNNGSDDELQINDDEQERRSTKSPEVQFYDQSNSNAPSESDISRLSSKHDQLVMDDDDSVISDQFHAREAIHSNYGSEDELQINYTEQQRRSMRSPEVQFNDQSNSNAPNESDISRFTSKHDQPVMDDDDSVISDQFHAREAIHSNYGSEDELQINYTEQQRRSMRSPEVQFNDQSNSNAPNESDISRFTSKHDQPVMDDDDSVISDQFHAREAIHSNYGSEDELQINYNEQQRRSMRCPEVQFNDQSNSNAPNESDISRFSSKHDQPVMDDDDSVISDEFHARKDEINNGSEEQLQINVSKQRRSTKSPEVEFNDQSNSNAPRESDISSVSSKHNQLAMDDDDSVISDEFHAEDDNESNNGSEDELQINVSKQRRSTKSPEVEFNDQSNSNAPRELDISSVSSKHDQLVMDDDDSIISDEFYASEDESNNSSEDELQINVSKQQRRSTKSPEVQFNDQSNSIAPNESDISRLSSKHDQLVMDDDDSVISDEYHAREDESNNGSDDELQINDDEQERRSTKSPEVQFNDQSNSNAPNESDISRFRSKHDQLVMDDDDTVISDEYHAREDESNNGSEDQLQINVSKQQRRSTKSQEVQFNDQSNSNAPNESDISRFRSKHDQLVMDDDDSVISDEFHAGEDESNNGSDDELQINDDEQERRSTKSPEVQFNDQSNSNAPNESDISRFRSKHDQLVMDDDDTVISDEYHAREDESNNGSEDQLQINVSKQQRRSMKLPEVPNNDQSNSNAPSESDISSCSSERNRLVIDDEVTVPIKQEYGETKAQFSRKRNFALYFGTDSDDNSTSEDYFEDEPEIEGEKENNFAGEYTDIEEAETSNQISLDKETFPAIFDNCSSENIDNMSCTCAKSEDPHPRSFKKWQVTNAALNRSHNIIIHASHKTREGEREVILEPIVEWQPELGACQQSAGKLRALALALMIRPNAELMNVRVDHEDGSVIMIEKMDEERFISLHGDKRSEIGDTIYKAIEQLHFLTPGQYILAHDLDKGPHAMIYSAGLSETGGSYSIERTLSLCPKKDTMSDAEESVFSKIPPILGGVVLPFHRDKEILPLAFTTDKSCVKGYKKKRGKKKPKSAMAQVVQAMKNKHKKSRRTTDEDQQET